MKCNKFTGKMALIALAAVCLLAAPALSMPMGDNNCRSGNGGMFALKNNLTPEEMDNMTLGQLKEMQMQACNQSQFCPAGGEGQNFRENCRNDEAPGSMMGMNERNGQKMERGQAGCDESRCGGSGCGDSRGAGQNDKGSRGMFGASPILLLMDDVSVEDLNNMTISEIRDLTQTKMQELDNMTLAEIKQLEEEKMRMKENMTLLELREENRMQHQMAGILGLAGPMRGQPQVDPAE